MSLSAQKITAQLLTLSEQEQQEAINFIEFLQHKSIQQPFAPENQVNTQTEGAKVLQILEDYELLGCIEGDGHLSENYKKYLWDHK